MIVVCPACSARFQYDETRFDGVPSKRFKCPKCAHVFDVANPAFTSPVPEATTSLPPLGDEGFGAEGMVFTEPAAPAPEYESESAHRQPGRTTARADRENMLAAAMVGLPANMRFSLAVLSGPQASTVVVIDKPLMVIGREDGDIATRDPEVSRRHASLEVRRDGTVLLQDLQSTNGTFLNGQRIEDTVVVSNRDEFTCGNSTFMLVVRDLNDFNLH
ncbi:MAG TPA: FHA domain-containing protein [Holophagaceae bacterium]|nr:FHA domain-containing protein [Holophagaceae bacterium]